MSGRERLCRPFGALLCEGHLPGAHRPRPNSAGPSGLRDGRREGQSGDLSQAGPIRRGGSRPWFSGRNRGKMPLRPACGRQAHGQDARATRKGRPIVFGVAGRGAMLAGCIGSMFYSLGTAGGSLRLGEHPYPASPLAFPARRDAKPGPAGRPLPQGRGIGGERRRLMIKGVGFSGPKGR